jgi:hypothetical protein
MRDAHDYRRPARILRLSRAMSRALRPSVVTWLLLAITATTLGAQDTTRVVVPAVPPPVPPPWRLLLDFGLQDIVGNRDLTVLSGAVVIEHRRQDRFILNNKLDVRYGRSNGQEAVNAQSWRLRFDWRPRAPVSPFVGLDLARDPIRKSAFRIQVGTGANFNFDVRDDRRTWVSVGFVGDYQEYTAGVDPSTSRDTRVLLRAATQRVLAGGSRVELMVRVQPSTLGAADYLASADASVRVAVTQRLGVTTRFLWLRDSRPPAGVRRDDRELSVSLSLAW